MTDAGYRYRLREPYGNPRERGAPPPVHSRTVEQGMIIERNVAVSLRDGVRVYADVFRPADEQPGPPIVIWTPYGKHWYGALEKDPNTAVREDMVSHYATFEGADPVYWVPAGYVIVNVDARGTWYSEGTSTFLSPEEAEAFYDVIEWAGVQPWSTGKVGTDRRLLPVAEPVEDAPRCSRRTGGDEHLGGMERHLSRSRAPRRHARHVVLDEGRRPTPGA